MECKTILYKSDEYRQVVALRQKILRDPLGMKFTGRDLLRDKDETICICMNDEKIVGCIQLAYISNETVKFRQMAIDNAQQAKGIGSQLLKYAENIAQEQGYYTIELHARITAKDFYLKNGYEIISDVFTEVGIPHTKMKKKYCRDKSQGFVSPFNSLFSRKECPKNRRDTMKNKK